MLTIWGSSGSVSARLAPPATQSSSATGLLRRKRGLVLAIQGLLGSVCARMAPPAAQSSSAAGLLRRWRCST